MDNSKILFKTFILIAMCQRALCSNNGGCDCDVLQINRFENSKHSFDKIYTKQSFNINGRPFYVSKEEDTIWWNDTRNNASDSWDFHQFVEKSRGILLNIVKLM